MYFCKYDSEKSFSDKNKNKKNDNNDEISKKRYEKTFCSQYYQNYAKTSFTVASC